MCHICMKDSDIGSGKCLSWPFFSSTTPREKSAKRCLCMEFFEHDDCNYRERGWNDIEKGGL